MRRPVDSWFFWIVAALAAGGLFIFFSASLGLLARDGASFSAVALNQLLGFLLGSVALFLATRFHYKSLKTYSFLIFLFSLILTAFVFIPGVGFSHGGATRWLNIFGVFSFQPSELLKLGFVLYLAAWLSSSSSRLVHARYGIAPFLILIGVVGILLLKQPDTGTFLVIFAAGVAQLLVAGVPLRHIGIVGILAAGGLAALSFLRPYLWARITVFFNPAIDPQGIGYQLQQSLIAIAQGEVFGRGFGQSVQKFNFLPEPINDSIFAVFSEEFGFIGGLALLSLFLVFAARGFMIASRAPDQFSRLLTVGIVILVMGQAFLNMGSMTGIFPLTGLPLPFVSHGGTALLLSLTEAGIVLGVSRYMHKR